MGRYDIQSSAGTLYLEASGRVGNSKAEFRAKNFSVANRRARYDTSGTYFGAHAGIGYDMRVAESADLDVYFKYLWNKQNSADERVLGASFTLDDAYSSRIRTGGRLKLDYDGFIKPYVGGAYIYEFMGETDARAYGYNLPSADLKGSSAMAELGVTLLSGDTLPISLDVGAQGYFGNRRGMSGSLDVKYEF
jgi:outer membrane autotransporter protein